MAYCNFRATWDSPSTYSTMGSRHLTRETNTEPITYRSRISPSPPPPSSFYLFARRPLATQVVPRLPVSPIAIVITLRAPYCCTLPLKTKLWKEQTRTDTCEGEEMDIHSSSTYVERARSVHSRSTVEPRKRGEET